jgi:hypothetical protein
MKHFQTEPSLADLAFLLRHKKHWPDGFVWDYTHKDHCADGLSRKVFGRDVPGLAESHVTYAAAAKRNIPMQDVTPEMVADDIDIWQRK